MLLLRYAWLAALGMGVVLARGGWEGGEKKGRGQMRASARGRSGGGEEGGRREEGGGLETMEAQRKPRGRQEGSFRRRCRRKRKLAGWQYPPSERGAEEQADR